jgi:hypothetical protein
MAAIQGRDTDARNKFGLLPFLVAAGAHIYAGTMVVLNATGYAEPATTALGKISVGRAREEVDNTLGQDGDELITVEQGEFKFDNSADADAITISEVGDACYATDDQTVAKTNGGGTKSMAGYITGVDDDGVWVNIRVPIGAGAGLAAANNLSDVASAATARANIGANKLALDLDVTDLVAADAKVFRKVSPVAGTIKKIYSVLEVHALAAGDATLTGKIGAVAITDGVATITQAGSAVGDVDVATPTAANVVAIGDVISVTVGGANTDATATAKVTVYIEY